LRTSPRARSKPFFFSGDLLFVRFSSQFIWRAPFLDVVGIDLYDIVLAEVGRQLDLNYPDQAPWAVLDTERTPKGPRTRIWLQIYREQEKRQPIHFDSGLTWYRNERGPWTGLSVILNVNDGVAPYLAARPVAGVFENVRAAARSGKSAELTAKAVQGLLQTYETAFLDPKVRNRAGQITAFAPGDQPHAGMGFDGSIDPLNASWTGRVVLYLFFVPESEKAKVEHLPLFSSEYPWGLMHGGVTETQVEFGCFIFFLNFLVFWRRSWILMFFIACVACGKPAGLEKFADGIQRTFF
jgi:hypothetical protein